MESTTPYGTRPFEALPPHQRQAESPSPRRPPAQNYPARRINPSASQPSLHSIYKHQMATTQRVPEDDLHVQRQRRPLMQMPQPEVPLSVQSQLLQMQPQTTQPYPPPYPQHSQHPHSQQLPQHSQQHQHLPHQHLPHQHLQHPQHAKQHPQPYPQYAASSHYGSNPTTYASHHAPLNHASSEPASHASAQPSSSEKADRVNRPMPKLPPIKIPTQGESGAAPASAPGGSVMTPVAPASPRRMPTTPIAAAAITQQNSPRRNMSSPALTHRRFGSETKQIELTVDQFETARRQAQTRPHDPRAQLEFARKLLDASDHLSGRYTSPTQPSTIDVDAAQQQRNREAWNAQAIKIAKHLATKTQFPDAMFLLGSIYSSRRYGVDVNYIKALEWYSKAAKLDHAEAANRIAVCEEFGVGTQRNSEKAVSWYKRAAMLGSTGAMYKLGMLSMLGSLDQPRDFRTGLAWLNRAADRADAKTPHAVHELALLHEHSPLSTYTMGDPLPKNDSTALELFYTAARFGYAPAQSRLGRAFEFGELGCEIDPNYSISWYSQAAQQGDSNAELAMAGWYWTGAPQILKKNDTEAFLWAERAAQKGNTRALYCVGFFYETGTGVPVDARRARKFYTLAAEKKHPRAVQKLNEIP